MPYEFVEDLPKPVKKLPLRARVIWMDAFNRAYYAMDLPEDRCFAYAWGAVRRAGYRKDIKTGEWKGTGKAQEAKKEAFRLVKYTRGRK